MYIINIQLVSRETGLQGVFKGSACLSAQGLWPRGPAAHDSGCGAHTRRQLRRQQFHHHLAPQRILARHQHARAVGGLRTALGACSPRAPNV